MTHVSPIWALATLVANFLLSWWLTGRVLGWLRHRAILDHPNDRSSHAIPTPRGGGWGVMLTLLPVWTLIAIATGGVATAAPILIGTAALMAVSWMDDRRGLGPAPRFLTQIVAVAAGMGALPAAGLVFQGLLPFWADRLVAAIGWLWFVNLFNFMDGIDGLAASQALVAASAYALLAGNGPVAWLGVALAAACAGFLPFNLPRARIFLGDVGSGALGYLLASLAVLALPAVEWARSPLLLLPLIPFIVDASLTLARRMLRGERWWEAHDQHAYQSAARRAGHGPVTAAFLAGTFVAAAFMVAAKDAAPIVIMCASAVAVALACWAWWRLQAGGWWTSPSGRDTDT